MPTRFYKSMNIHDKTKHVQSQTGLCWVGGRSEVKSSAAGERTDPNHQTPHFQGSTADAVRARVDISDHNTVAGLRFYHRTFFTALLSPPRLRKGNQHGFPYRLWPTAHLRRSSTRDGLAAVHRTAPPPPPWRTLKCLWKPKSNSGMVSSSRLRPFRKLSVRESHHTDNAPIQSSERSYPALATPTIPSTTACAPGYTSSRPAATISCTTRTMSRTAHRC